MSYEGGALISNIKQVSGRTFERILAEKNIEAFNGAQGRILYVLWQQDGISLKSVSDKTGLAATTLTSMIDRMEKQGLVVRTYEKSDRRKTSLKLTERAKALENDYNEVSDEMNRIFYKGFTDTEIVELENQLKRILDNLKEA